MIINGQKGKASISRIILKGVMLFSIIACVGAVTHGQSTESKLKTDPIIQNLVDQILKKGISKAEARSGYAAVSDPNTGVILAASYFKKEGDKFIRQSVEHFIAKPYEPYSLFKPMVASVALERKVMDENTVVNAEGGKINVGGRYFYDWKDFGDVTLADSVAQSSTIGIYRAADAIGEENLLKDLKKFGFGSNEHENIGWDKDGILEMAKGKDQKFNLIYLANGIGNIQVTPIEIMQAYGAIANGGKLLEPRSYSSENVKPKVLRQALSEVTALRMKRILNRVVTEGTGKWAQSSKYTISGKTASGFVDRLKVTEATKNANQAQFIGFAPFDKPKLIVHVIIHEPNGGAHGSKHAAPVVRSILNRVLGYKKIKSDHYASAY